MERDHKTTLLPTQRKSFRKSTKKTHNGTSRVSRDFDDDSVDGDIDDDEIRFRQQHEPTCRGNTLRFLDSNPLQLALYVLIVLDAVVVIAEILLDMHAMRSQYRETTEDLERTMVFFKDVYSDHLDGYDGDNIQYVLDKLLELRSAQNNISCLSSCSPYGSHPTLIIPQPEHSSIPTYFEALSRIRRSSRSGSQTETTGKNRSVFRRFGTEPVLNLNRINSTLTVDSGDGVVGGYKITGAAVGSSVSATAATAAAVGFDDDMKKRAADMDTVQQEASVDIAVPTSVVPSASPSTFLLSSVLHGKTLTAPRSATAVLERLQAEISLFAASRDADSGTIVVNDRAETQFTPLGAIEREMGINDRRADSSSVLKMVTAEAREGVGTRVEGKKESVNEANDIASVSGRSSKFYQSRKRRHRFIETNSVDLSASDSETDESAELRRFEAGTEYGELGLSQVLRRNADGFSDDMDDEMKDDFSDALPYDAIDSGAKIVVKDAIEIREDTKEAADLTGGRVYLDSSGELVSENSSLNLNVTGNKDGGSYTFVNTNPPKSPTFPHSAELSKDDNIEYGDVTDDNHADIDVNDEIDFKNTRAESPADFNDSEIAIVDNNGWSVNFTFWGIIAGEELKWKNSTKDPERYYRNHTYIAKLLKIAHMLHYGGIAILGLFVLQVILKMVGMGVEFFKKKYEIFDAVIVMTSFSLDLVYVDGVTGAQSEEAIALLIVFLLWRILRIVNGIMITSKKRQDLRIQLHKRARRRAHKKIEYLEDDKNWKEV